MLTARRHAISTAAIAALILSAGCDLVDDAGDSPEVGSDDRAVVNGNPVVGYANVGALMLGSEGNSQMICTGTLIGCDTFLTAAHCVCEDSTTCNTPRSPAEMQVFFPSAGYFQVASIDIHPQYGFPNDDIAIARLQFPVEGIEPAPIATEAPAIGGDLIISGFGRTMKDVNDGGLLREGDMIRAACEGFDDDRMLCYQPTESPTVSCSGDSGGPNFTDIGGELHVAGVVSGGGTAQSCADRQKFATYAPAYNDFVLPASGQLGNTSCGVMPAAGQPGTVFESGEGFVSAGNNATHTIEVPSQTAELRVAANSLVSQNLRLFVRANEPADVVFFDCFAEGRMTAYCQIDSPPAGTYHVMLAGDTQYQLSMIALPGAPLAMPDAYTITAGEVAEFTIDDSLLGNDQSYLGGEPVVVRVTEQPAQGTVLTNPRGEFRYEPPELGEDEQLMVGTMTFRYEIEEAGYTSEAEVTLEVLEPSSGGCAVGSGAGGASMCLLVLALVAIRRRRPDQTR